MDVSKDYNVAVDPDEVSLAPTDVSSFADNLQKRILRQLALSVLKIFDEIYLWLPLSSTCWSPWEHPVQAKSHVWRPRHLMDLPIILRVLDDLTF